MVLNTEKCHFMSLGNKKEDELNPIVLDNVTLPASSAETLLGVIIDDKLTFNKHIKMLCKKPVKS